MPVPQSTAALLAAVEDATLRSASWGDQAAELRHLCGTQAERKTLAQAYTASLIGRGVPADKATDLASRMVKKLQIMADALDAITDSCAYLYGAAQDLAAISESAKKAVEDHQSDNVFTL